jgi:Fe-S oxidoreductase
MDIGETISALLELFQEQLSKNNSNPQEIINNTKDKIVLACYSCISDIHHMATYLPPLQLDSGAMLRADAAS